MRRALVRVLLAGFVVVGCATPGVGSTGPATSNPAGTAGAPDPVVAEVRQRERDRIAALVAGDVAAAEPFFAMDYWLIDPGGGSSTRQQYLDAVGSGALDYVSWKPVSDITVLVRGDVAIIRYRASIELAGEGASQLWHTDLYEKRDGRWQVVWSQATLG